MYKGWHSILCWTTWWASSLCLCIISELERQGPCFFFLNKALTTITDLQFRELVVTCGEEDAILACIYAESAPLSSNGLYIVLSASAGQHFTPCNRCSKLHFDLDLCYYSTIKLCRHTNFFFFSADS